MNNDGTKIRTLISIVLLSFTILSVLFIEYQQTNRNEVTRTHLSSEANRELSVIRSRLEADIYSDIFYANSLATLITVSPETKMKQWEMVAKELFRKSKNLRNLAIAPDDVIQFVYPLEANKAAIGFDFRSSPAQWRTVKKARETQEIFLAGPVNLVQGGVGLIARTPIFTDPPHNTQYWGACSVVIDIDKLFNDSGVYALQKRYAFAIRGKDGTGEQGDIFLGNESVFDHNYVNELVHLPSGRWEMAIDIDAMLDSQPWYQTHLVRLIGYPALVLVLITFCTIFYLYHIAHRNSLQDELTHLPNRRYFMRILENRLDNPSTSHFTLLNLDLVKFKAVNDTYGHDVGDRLLYEVARGIEKVLSPTDIVARVGGDEFLILLTLTNDHKVQMLVESLKQQIRLCTVEAENQTVYADVSIGYTISSSQMTNNADILLRQADVSMYSNKKEG